MEEKLQQLANQLQVSIEVQGDILGLIGDLQKKVNGLEDKISRLDSRTNSMQIIGGVKPQDYDK